MVLYRKYRPQKFSDIVGHEQIVKTLLNQLESGKISHGYLFCGPKGTGKTSTARILAKAVNCQVYQKQGKGKDHKFGEPCNKCISCLAVTDGSHLDLIEIDAASNRNIDDIRDLREKIKLSPVSGRFKVYIIDEVHMLTKEAFNALLKTLEEPPSHAIFILCTTEVAKLPQTIISRVQRFSFAKATEEELGRSIAKVAKGEGIKMEAKAISSIARIADGSFRDAISILDQLSVSNKPISENDVKSLIILTDLSHIFSFVELLVERNLQGAILLTVDLVKNGLDISHFAKEVILFLEKMLFIKIGIGESLLDMDPNDFIKMNKLSEKMSLYEMQNLMKLFLIAESEIKLYPLPQIPVTLAICKYCLPKVSEDLSGQSSGDVLGDLSNKVKPELPKGTSPSKPTNESVGNKSSVKKSAKSFAIIGKHWGDFLNRVRPQNTHIMAILRSTRPIDFNNDNLILEVFYRFHKEKLEEPKITSMLEGLLFETLGFNVGLKFILGKRENNLPKSVSKSDVVDVDFEHFDKVSREIAEIFSK